MKVMYNYGEFSVGFAEEAETAIVTEILSKAVVNGQIANARKRQQRTLDAHIRKTTKEQTTVLLSHYDVIIGAAIVYDRRENLIQYINILDEYKVHISTGILIHYITNEIFKDEPVYFYSKPDKFDNVSLKAGNGLYQLNDNVAEQMQAMYGDI